LAYMGDGDRVCEWQAVYLRPHAILLGALAFSK